MATDYIDCNVRSQNKKSFTYLHITTFQITALLLPYDIDSVTFFSITPWPLSEVYKVSGLKFLTLG